MSKRFEQMNLHGVDFSGQDLRGVRFEQCNLGGANFTGAKLNGARFEQCNLFAATVPHDAVMIAAFEQCNMGGVRFVKTEPETPKQPPTAEKVAAPPQRGQGTVRPHFSAGDVR